MQIVIVHYHLNRGGVTQVIVNHLRALAETSTKHGPVRAAICYGGRKEAWPEATVNQLDGVDVELLPFAGLDYTADQPPRPRELAAELATALARLGWDSSETVIHVHNHALGKNSSFPGAVFELARHGFGLVLQIHDFAEDFRPENYQNLVKMLAPDDSDRLPELLYRQGPSIHYAVLNGRDHRILLEAGVPRQQLHSLPNPVCDSGPLADRSEARARLEELFGVARDERYVLYPVRGIRRKNLGELLLWAAASEKGLRFAATLAPLNPAETGRYRNWKALADKLKLPVLFEVGAPQALDFPQNLAAADLTITTSVAEGFGMVFLETWLANLPLVGRDLPEITADFVAAGVQLPNLAPTVQVPIEWVGAEPFLAELKRAYIKVLAAYRRDVPSDAAFAESAAPLCADGLLDFARCSARLQALIVSRVATEPKCRDQLRELNPGILAASKLDTPKVREQLNSNADAVRANFSLQKSGQRLRDLYRQVLDSPRNEPESIAYPSIILDSFLSLHRLNPIRNE